jgi:DNA-binding beta-propeller fold protein YncE
LASDGTVRKDFSTGNTPVAVVFDGNSIWVANMDDHTVTKLRASDGLPQGTFSTGTTTPDPSPVALAFDGANVWVANRDSNDVTKK